MEVERIRQVQFKASRRGEGYEVGYVDDFLDSVIAATAADEPVGHLLTAFSAPPPPRLAKGYDSEEVDTFVRRLLTEGRS